MTLDQLFQAIIRAGDTVFDIGAYEGELSRQFAALTGTSGVVYAFEPNPSRFLELSKKAYSSPARNLLPYCKAIADISGHCPIFLAPPATAKSSTIIPGLGTESRLGPGIEVCLAEAVTLDDFVRETACKPAFVKIDTEGAEKLVFTGGRRVFEIFRPRVVFEGSFGYSEERQAYCFNEAVPSHISWLESIGYRIFIIDIDFFRDQWVTQDSAAHCSRYQLLSVSASDFQHMPVMGCNLLAVHTSDILASDIDRSSTALPAREYIARFSPTY